MDRIEVCSENIVGYYDHVISIIIHKFSARYNNFILGLVESQLQRVIWKFFQSYGKLEKLSTSMVNNR